MTSKYHFENKKNRNTHGISFECNIQNFVIYQKRKVKLSQILNTQKSYLID